MRRPIFHPKLTSQHLHAFDVNRFTIHLAGYGNMMSFMACQRVGIVNREHLLVPVGHNHHFGAFGKALLCAVGRFFIRALSAALGIGYITLYGRIVGGERDPDDHEHNSKSKTDQQQLSHGEYLLNFSAAGPQMTKRLEVSLCRKPSTVKRKVGWQQESRSTMRSRI
jgi:hypothetical protein